MLSVGLNNNIITFAINITTNANVEFLVLSVRMNPDDFNRDRIENISIPPRPKESFREKTGLLDVTN